MRLAEKFNAWAANPTGRNCAALVREMQFFSKKLEKAGLETTWHELLEVRCHEELITALQLLSVGGGASDSRLVRSAA